MRRRGHLRGLPDPDLQGAHQRQRTCGCSSAPSSTAPRPTGTRAGWRSPSTATTTSFAPNVGHIMVMLADGSHKHVIVRGDADSHYGNPSFSPDGTRDRLHALAARARRQPRRRVKSSIWTAWVTGHQAPADHPAAPRTTRPTGGPPAPPLEQASSRSSPVPVGLASRQRTATTCGGRGSSMRSPASGIRWVQMCTLARSARRATRLVASAATTRHPPPSRGGRSGRRGRVRRPARRSRAP